MTTTRFEVYEDAGGEWRWRLIAGNGRIVATSGEGYTKQSDVERAIMTVKSVARSAAIEEAE